MSNEEHLPCVTQGGRGSTRGKKETTLQDLEKIFSEHVDSILRKYGIVVDNVTITKIDLDTSFIERSEEVQKARMDARKKVYAGASPALGDTYLSFVCAFTHCIPDTCRTRCR